MKNRSQEAWCYLIALVVSITLVGLIQSPAEAGHGEKRCPYEHSEGSFHSRDAGGRVFSKARFYLEHSTELGLLEDQMEKIKKLEFEAQKELIRKDAELEILDLDIQAGLHEDKIDVESLQALVDQKYEVKKAKAKYLIQAFADLKGTLTEEQVKKAKDLWLTEKK